MKGMKGRILKKLKSIPHVSYLKQGGILHLNSSDGFFENKPWPADSAQIFCDPPVCRGGEEEEDRKVRFSNLPSPCKPDMRDPKDEESEFSDDKENIRPASEPTDPTPRRRRKKKKNPDTTLIQSETGIQKPQIITLSNLDVSSFRRPDLNSGTLFDPDLLAAFEQAVMDHIRTYEEVMNRARGVFSQEEEVLDRDEEESQLTTKEDDPLTEFDERCPPGGSESVIMYTTSLRGIRKTFEDCNSIRFLLGSFKVMFHERDVSMHMEFREELWRVLGGRAIPPRLFIRGRYIGGADEVLGLHEQGKLLPLMQGLPLDRSGGVACDRCAGIRFVLCLECNGSRKLYTDDEDDAGISIQCHHCNENGLILCPLCC